MTFVFCFIHIVCFIDEKMKAWGHSELPKFPGPMRPHFIHSQENHVSCTNVLLFLCSHAMSHACVLGCISFQVIVELFQTKTMSLFYYIPPVPSGQWRESLSCLPRRRSTIWDHQHTDALLWEEDHRVIVPFSNPHLELSNGSWRHESSI
jgi:hypothetical protein